MTTQKNGNQAVATTPKETGKVNTTLSVVVKKDEKEVSKVAPLDERLQRLDQLFVIQTKYQRLKASLTKLDELKLKKGGEENLSITISEKNSGRYEGFETSNPLVVPEVIDFVKETIKKKIKEIEPQLVW